MSYWENNATAFWDEFDSVVDTIEEHGLTAIFSIGNTDWWWSANEAYAGLNETLNDQVLNQSSVSCGMMQRYVHDLVTRYQNRSAVLMWELGNELNLRVDLPPPVSSALYASSKAPSSPLSSQTSAQLAVCCCPFFCPLVTPCTLLITRCCIARLRPAVLSSASTHLR